MPRWRATIEYTPLITKKREWKIVEVEATTVEAATQRALVKAGLGPIRAQLTHVKVDVIQIP